MCSSSLLALLSVLTASTPEVTLDEALSLALQHNADLKVTRAEVEVEQA